MQLTRLEPDQKAHAVPSIGRVLTAMASPMVPSADGPVLDLDGAQRLATHLVDNGNDGVVVAGTTGESPTLTHSETLDLFRAVTEAVGDRARVIAGCGKNDTAATVELVREASRLGIAGVMLVTPYYNRPSQRGLREHFLAAAATTDLPVLLYNIPSRTACEVAPATLLDLAESAANICGVKDAVGDPVKAGWLISRAPETFEVWAGDDATSLPLAAVGAVGVVSVAGHLVGAELTRMYDLLPTDAAAARAVYLRLLPLIEALFVEPNPVPLKAALGLLGLPAGPVRLPLAPASEDTIALVRGVMVTLGLLHADGSAPAQTSTPAGSASAGQQPQARAPQARVPQARVPQARAPQAQVPQAQVPRVQEVRA